MQQSEQAGRARPSHARIRAYRRDDARTQLERRLLLLGIGLGPFAVREREAETAKRVARALRRERRAARTGGFGYDPLRHLVLVRLTRAMRRERLDVEKVI
jgi:hypothetical protein